MNPLKTGLRTTEWWSQIIVHLLAVLTLFGVTTPGVADRNKPLIDALALIASAIAAAGYQHSRGLVKAAALAPTPAVTELATLAAQPTAAHVDRLLADAVFDPPEHPAATRATPAPRKAATRK